MDNQRLLIWGVFAFLAWITYQTWVEQNAPLPVEPVVEQAGDAISMPGATADNEELPALSDVPVEASSADALPATPETTTAPVAQTSAPVIKVTTDVFEIEISTQKGLAYKAGGSLALPSRG